MTARSKLLLLPNGKKLSEIERTQNNRECVVVSPYRSRAVFSQGHQQFQSIHWYWVWSQQNVLIPEREGGKGIAKVKKKRSRDAC